MRIVALKELVALGGSAKDKAAFPARFNERHALPVTKPCSQFPVAGDTLRAAVGDVKAARWRLFNDKLIADLLRDGGQPGVEKLALVIEVEDFQVAGNLSADDADGIRCIRKPGRDVVGAWKLLLELLPGGNARALLFSPGGQDGQPDRMVLLGISK